jgi:hypothetical protein
VRFNRGAVLEAAELEPEGEESELESGMGEEELIELLRQLCVSAAALQDLSGRSTRKQAQVLRGPVVRVTQVVQYYGTVEAESLFAEVELYLDF